MLRRAQHLIINFDSRIQVTIRPITLIILDTLSAYLDPSSLVVKGSSHEMDWYISGWSELKFNFPNINLLDSNSNEPESHGFVDFSIKIRDDVLDERQVINKAGIYFDYNEPVITNEVLRTVGEPTGIKFIEGTDQLIRIYPNPTKKTVNIETQTDRTNLRIRNTIGQTLGMFRLQKGVNQINLDLPTGMYLIEFEQEG